MKTPNSLTMVSWRDRVQSLLRDSQLAAFVEILIVIAIYVLKTIGLLPMSKIPLLLFGSVSLWLRRCGWRGGGMGRPASWKWTIVLGVGIAVLDTVFGWPIRQWDFSGKFSRFSVQAPLLLQLRLGLSAQSLVLSLPEG